MLYIIQDLGSALPSAAGRTWLVKVGVSVNPAQRLRQLQTGNPHELKLAFECRCPEGLDYKAEAVVHQHLRAQHVRLEWFRLTEDEIVTVAATLAQFEGNLNGPERNK